jgi:hypothetical protein
MLAQRSEAGARMVDGLSCIYHRNLLLNQLLILLLQLTSVLSVGAAAMAIFMNMNRFVFRQHAVLRQPLAWCLLYISGK